MRARERERVLRNRIDAVVDLLADDVAARGVDVRPGARRALRRSLLDYSTMLALTLMVGSARREERPLGSRRPSLAAPLRPVVQRVAKPR